jgi:DNA repair protein RadC
MNKKLELPEMLTLNFDTPSAFEKLLAFSIGEQKSKESVGRLLNRYGSLATIFSESEEEICRVGCVNMNTALLIKLIAYVNARKVTEKFEYGKIHTELELREFIGALFLGSSVESVYVILLDKDGRTIATEHISDGTVSTSDVTPRKILEFARKRKATQVIIAHNHPKGTPTPSKDDIMTTGRLFNLFSGVGITLRSHYVVADGVVGRIESDNLYNPDYLERKSYELLNS